MRLAAFEHFLISIQRPHQDQDPGQKPENQDLLLSGQPNRRRIEVALVTAIVLPLSRVTKAPEDEEQNEGAWHAKTCNQQG